MFLIGPDLFRIWPSRFSNIFIATPILEFRVLSEKPEP